jgi:hypothetical protein
MHASKKRQSTPHMHVASLAEQDLVAGVVGQLGSSKLNMSSSTTSRTAGAGQLG